MSLYIVTTREKIETYRECVTQFQRMRGRYYKRRKRQTHDPVKYQQLTASIKYFNSRITYYGGKIKLLEQWGVNND